MKIEPSFEIETIKVIEFLGKVYKNISNEVKDILRIGLDEYLTSQIEKQYLTNTFIHRKDKVPLYQVYYPISVQYENKKYYFNNPIAELGPNHYVCIIGGAGNGKSMLTKHIFLQCIKSSLKIPHIIELRNLNNASEDFEAFVLKRLSQKNIKPTDELLLRSLKNGNHLFILDGYDEIYSDKLSQINLGIEDFIDKFKNNYFIITSRPNAGAELLPRFKPYYFSELLKSEVIDFVYKIIPEIERKHRIADVIRKPESKDYFHYLKNPLLLSMFLMTFENYPELPRTKAQFYRNVFETLYSTHDGILKNSFERHRPSGLKKDEFEKVLNGISYVTLANGIFVIGEFELIELLKKIKPVLQINYEENKLIYDLVTTTSILIKDGINIHYPHRSMQEYFSACFIKELSEPKHKEEAFNTFSSLVSANTNDDYFNFWDLCKELDSQSFNKFFILKSLKTIQKNIYRNDIIEILIAFSEIYGIQISINSTEKVMLYKTLPEKKRVHGRVFSKGVYLKAHQIKNSFEKLIINYLNMNPLFDWVNKIFFSPDFLNLLEDELVNFFIEKNSYRENSIQEKISFNDFIKKNEFVKPGLLNFLIEKNYKNRLLRLPEIVSEKVLEIEMEIMNNESNVHSLINISGIKRL